MARRDDPWDEHAPLDKAALDELFSTSYQELRRLALRVKQRDGSLTLNPTALVNEAWLKLAKSPPFAAASPLHFKRIAARAMRQVLVDAARRRSAGKRGGRSPQLTVALESTADPIAGADEFLALDAALDDLARLSPRQAQVVEHRFFGGLEARETALLLDVSEATVLRDWRAARAWLALQVHQR